VSELRESLYDDLEAIRKLRNRIAHHEPIFARNIPEDFQNILALIEFRSKVTAEWTLDNQQASALIKSRP
jgi:hypothetical protein